MVSGEARDVHFTLNRRLCGCSVDPAFFLLALVLCLTAVNGQVLPYNKTAGHGLCNSLGSDLVCKSSCTSMGCALSVFQYKDYTSEYRCSSYLLIPAENLWSPALRSFLYMVALLYCFLGLAAITGIFMRAIEMIVSKRVEVTRRDSMGVVETFVEKYWNATIANITLLALGTSAPEILLMLIDTIKHLRHAPGELGPGTIMGSAAFNLLVILAVCVVTPKRGVVRRIEDFAVFMVELVSSLWAYVWLLIILKFSSPNVIEIWEAAVTLLQFPLFVFVAFGQDRSWSISKMFFKGKDEAGGNGGPVPQPSVTTGGSRLSQTDATTRPERSTADNNSQRTPTGCTPGFSQFGFLASHNLKYRTHAMRAVGGNPPPHAMDAEEIEGEDKIADELPSSLVPPGPPLSNVPAGACLVAYQDTTTLTLPFADVGLAGQWLPPFTVPVEDCSLPLVLEIRDRQEGGLRKGISGRVTIDLRDLSPEAVDTAWYAVQREEGEDGRAMLNIQLLLRRREAAFELSVTILGMRGSLAADAATSFGSTENLLSRAPSTAAPRLFRVLTSRRPAWSKIRTQWYLQFLDAMMMRSQSEDVDSPSSNRDMVMHVLAFYWKVLFAFIPPPSLGGGWPTFFAALAFIGAITAVVVEIATLFSCASGMHVYLTAIVFVAVGTSLPDLLASRIATQHEPTADSAIANINGSNSVNVFLGIGLPWLIAAIYNRVVKHQSFRVDSKLLVFSLIVFFTVSFICLSVLFIRRFFFGGELGGNSKSAAATSLLYVVLWCVFVVLSGLRSYQEI